MFQATISPILRSTRLWLQLVVESTDDAACWWPGWGVTSHQEAALSVFLTTGCKHSLVLLRIDEIITRKKLSWLKLLMKLLLFYLVGCLYYCIKENKISHFTQQAKVWYQKHKGVYVSLRWIQCYWFDLHESKYPVPNNYVAMLFLLKKYDELKLAILYRLVPVVLFLFVLTITIKRNTRASNRGLIM
jgi:hypothetical protein